MTDPAPVEAAEAPRSGSNIDSDASTDPAVIAAARQVRRVGYTILFGLILWLTVPVTGFIVYGMAQGAMWDPYTKLAIPPDGDHRAVGCYALGMDLLRAKHQGAPKGAEATADWVARCGGQEPKLAEWVVSETRAP